MPEYEGLTFANIVDATLLIAEQNGLAITEQFINQLMNEALRQVSLETFEADTITTIAWPSSSSISLSTNAITNPYDVFADSQQMEEIPYDDYRQMFLGTVSAKSKTDKNIYYSILKKTLFIEPSVTGVTNLIIVGLPAYSLYDQDTSTTPVMSEDFRMLIPHKIISLIYPQWIPVYGQHLKVARRNKSKRVATGMTTNYNWFAGDEERG